MAGSDSSSAPRERLSFNSDWRFQRGDAPDANGQLGYGTLRPWLLATGVELISEGLPKPERPLGNPGQGVSFTEPGFDDSGWRKLDVPHDFGVEGPFAQELPGETGKLPWHGVAWYRKRFTLPKSDRDRRIMLEVDGAMAFSSFWLNGQLVGGWPYGYSSFTLDLTPYLDFDGENVLAVRLENPELSSRWYPGSGLYRNLWLTKTESVRVAHWGVFVTTPRITERRAIVNVDVTLENLSNAELELSLETHLHELDADGQPREKASASSEPVVLKLPAGLQAQRTHCIELKKPKLWEQERPRRYVAVTELRAGDRLLDRVETPFGVRSVEVDPDVGFLLNGKRVALNGVCMHHDLGALGTALNTRALERQLTILQEMGCNAVRTSHNPPAPELLELCDRRGLLLMVEAFDCWRRGKKHPEGLKAGDPGFRYFDYASVFDEWHERDLRAMVRRDRNHPSVVMWSIGNEVIEQWYSDGWKLSTRLAGLVREEDRTRPITSAFNGEIAGYSGFQTAVDVVGYNYKPWAYEKLHQANPTLAIVGSETSSCISSRGEYFFPVSDDVAHGQVNFQVSSYDLSTPPWAVLPDREFAGLDGAPYVAGEFVWTGFDYLGEPTPYNTDSTNLLNFSDPNDKAKLAEELARLGKLSVPSRSSYFGIIDLAGFPKDRFYLYQSRWRPELPMAHILPHWTWPERVGEITPVHVYSSGDEAELFLNKKSLGKRKRKAGTYRFRWDDVVYEPGKLKVVVTRHGKKWASATRRTAGPASKLLISADRKKLSADGLDLSFLTFTVADEHDELVPRSKPLIRFTLDGPGSVAAVDNGDPTSFEPFQASQRHAFNGLALCVVRSCAGQPGEVRVRAEADGLSAAEIVLSSKAR
jgi:beta-galactosidase